MLLVLVLLLLLLLFSAWERKRSIALLLTFELKQSKIIHLWPVGEARVFEL